jgi:signal transduction histidine kinase/CHASE3 domain sensor protein
MKSGAVRWIWLSGLVLLLTFLGGVYLLSNMARETAWDAHTEKVRIAISELRSTMVDAETSSRGYLVTGDPAFLEPNVRAVSMWRLQAARIHALTSDRPEQQERLLSLDHLIERELDTLGRQRAAYDAGQRGKALLTLMNDGRAVMDQIRFLIGQMEATEAAIDTERERESFGRWRWTVLLFVGGAFGLLLIGGQTWLQRRIDAERRLMQAVLGGIEDGITLQDRNGRLVFANESAAKLIGFVSPQALLAAPLSELLQRFEMFGEDGQPFPIAQLPARAALEGKAAGGAVTLRYRVRGVSGDRWSKVRAFPVLNSAGQVSYAINVFQDVTAEHRQAERRDFLLRVSEELSKSLDYERTLAAVARLSVPTMADWCSVDVVEGEKIKRVATHHVDPDKVALVLDIERRYPRDAQSGRGVSHTLRTGEAQLAPEIPRETLVAAAVDGEHLKMIDALDLHSYMVVPIQAGSATLGAIVFATAESQRRYGPDDLIFARELADRAALAITNARLFAEVERARATTTRKLADETQRRELAESESRFAEMFVGILGHDLRNPLNAILMTARLLERRADVDRKVTDRIVSSAQRMSNMVGQLLDLTRSRLGGGIPVLKMPVDLTATISEIVDELRSARPERDIRWTPTGDARTVVDADRMGQVVSNLLGNALEYGDPAQPVTVVLSCDGDGAVELVVHNRGPCIPDDLLPVIFDPFRRTTARGQRSRGLGLGLFISQQIVAAHGGTIDVRSSSAEGTTFTVRLPRATQISTTGTGLVA